MPSVLLTAASGAPFPLVSGNYWSGTGAFHPVGGIQLVYDRSGVGACWVGFSGGATRTSGGFLLSGSNADMSPLYPGDSRLIPKLALLSGTLNVYVMSDAIGSGISRLFWEPL